ncbi:MAG TPA: hypothetical protein VFE07_02655 [Marmoricola sp.]|nr:hypothetical protein [Marmoricola sp.]
MRLLSVHPGVTVYEVVEATGFELAIDAPDHSSVPETRTPEYSELVIIREMLDPRSLRDREVPPIEVTS